MKLLIIEDEYNLADAISEVLKKEKYNVKICTDGEDGYNEALTNLYDLILLDVMLPSKDGFEILEDLRKEKIESKIIMLTAKSDINDKLKGLNNGADDYITKPFHIDEVIARINIQLKKNNTNNLSYADIKLDSQTMNLKNIRNNKEINIIGKEYELLELFLHNSNQILDKELLFEKIWGFESNSEINTLEAYLSFLRKKFKIIESNVNIKAIRGVGYKLEVVNEKIKN